MELLRLKDIMNIYNPNREKYFSYFWYPIDTASKWYREVGSKAYKVAKTINPGRANDSKHRGVDEIEIDTLSGLVAEYFCRELLKKRYGADVMEPPDENKSINQTDITLLTKKTIEVRSSFVNNGISFGILGTKKKDGFDVIGPYTNGYKPIEIMKDYYFRVLYGFPKYSSGEKADGYMERAEAGIIEISVIGGATRAMMENPDLFYEEELSKEMRSSGAPPNATKYRKIKIIDGLDFFGMIDVIEKENMLEKIYKG